MSEIVQFPVGDRSNAPYQSRPAFSRTGGGNGRSMHTYVFRSLETILESGDADLARDVCFDLDKAEKKLRAVRLRLQRVQEQAADHVQRLRAADTKLTAAIIAALLSRQR